MKIIVKFKLEFFAKPPEGARTPYLHTTVDAVKEIEGSNDSQIINNIKNMSHIIQNSYEVKIVEDSTNEDTRKLYEAIEKLLRNRDRPVGLLNDI